MRASTISTASATLMARTRAPRLGSRSTMPSAVRFIQRTADRGAGRAVALAQVGLDEALVRRELAVQDRVLDALRTSFSYVLLQPRGRTTSPDRERIVRDHPV